MRQGGWHAAAIFAWSREGQARAFDGQQYTSCAFHTTPHAPSTLHIMHLPHTTSSHAPSTSCTFHTSSRAPSTLTWHNRSASRFRPQSCRTEKLQLWLQPPVHEPVWPSGKAGKRKDLGSIPLRLSFLFKKVVVCGHSLVTLSLTTYLNIKMLSSLPVLMQESFSVGVTV